MTDHSYNEPADAGPGAETRTGELFIVMKSVRFALMAAAKAEGGDA